MFERGDQRGDARAAHGQALLRRQAVDVTLGGEDRVDLPHRPDGERGLCLAQAPDDRAPGSLPQGAIPASAKALGGVSQPAGAGTPGTDAKQPGGPKIGHAEPDLYAELDPGIRDAVRLLRDHGWNTTQSGEGGEGHLYPAPTIELVLTDGMESVERLAMLLHRAGYGPFRIEVELLVPADGYWTRRATVVFGEWAPAGSRCCGAAWTIRTAAYGYERLEKPGG